MNALHAIVQGIIQGITEFLPISSSGHLSLYQHFFGVGGEGSVFFNLMLHLGTLVAVVAAFFEDVAALFREVIACVKDIFTGKFSLKTESESRKLLFMLVIATLPLLLVALLNNFVTGVSEDNDIVVEGVCFLITAGLLFTACKVKPGKSGIRQLKPQSALAIGVVQGIASLPGISRSGSTISAGMIFGFDRSFMVKFSFLMSIPAILGGVVFEIGDVAEQGIDVKAGPVALGVLAAAVFGYISIIFIQKLVLSQKFVYFAWYTLILGCVVILIGIVEHISSAMGFDARVSSQVATSVSSGVEAVLGAFSRGVFGRAV